MRITLAWGQDFKAVLQTEHEEFEKHGQFTRDRSSDEKHCGVELRQFVSQLAGQEKINCQVFW